MSFRAKRIAVAALMLAMSVARVGRAEDTAPDATSLLFESPQLANVRAGAVLTYDYHRKTSDDALYGASLQDKITLTFGKGSTEDARNVDVMLFSGANRRPAGPFEDMTGNPVLILFLEHHVETLAQLLHANPRYLKDTIRAALRDKAHVEKADLTVQEKVLPGWQIRIEPFKDDPNKVRMNGLGAMTYQFFVAKDVPGWIADIKVTAAGPSAVLLDEEVAYEAQSN